MYSKKCSYDAFHGVSRAHIYRLRYQIVLAIARPRRAVMGFLGKKRKRDDPILERAMAAIKAAVAEWRDDVGAEHLEVLEY